MKSCKNQRKAPISIMSGRLDLWMPAGVPLGCLSSRSAKEPCFAPGLSSWLIIGSLKDGPSENPSCWCGEPQRGHRHNLTGRWLGGSAAPRFRPKEVIWGG